MGRPKRSLARKDVELLHEALSYMRKRTFDQGEQIRLKGVLDQLEDLLLNRSESPKTLRLSPPEQEVLARQVEAYCGELTQRGGSPAGRQQARHLRGLVRLLGGVVDEKSWWHRLLRFLRR